MRRGAVAAPIVVVLLVAALASVALAMAWQVRGTAEQLQDQNASRVADTIAEHVASATDATEAAMLAMQAGARGWRLTPEDPHDVALLAELGAQVPGRGLAVVDASGRRLSAIGPGSIIPPADDPGHASMLAAMRRGGIGMSDAFDVGGTVVVGFSVPLNERPDAALVLYEKFSNLGLQLYLEQFGQGLGGDYYLLDASGAVVGTSTGAAAPEHPTPVTVDPAPGVRKVQADGEEVVALARSIGDVGWTLVYQQPVRTFYGQIAADHRRGALALVALIVVCGVAAAATTYHRHRTLTASETRLRGLLSNVSDLVLVLDGHRVTYASPAVEPLLGVPSADAVGVDLAALLGRPGANVLLDAVSTVAGHARPLTIGDIPCSTRSGTAVWVEATLADRTADRGIGGVVVSLHDVTERRQAAERMLHAATHDGLTDLPNRAHFQAKAQAAIDRARRHGHGLGLLYIDLDAFKPVNDRLGHEVGDRVLREVASRLKRTVRTVDVAARLGGDEFAILLEPIHDRHEAEEVAERVLAALREPFAGVDVPVGASIGITVSTAGGHDVDEMLRAADLAMYQAKSEGRNRFTTSPSSDVVPLPRTAGEVLLSRTA